MQPKFTTGELQLLYLWVGAALEDAEDERDRRLGSSALEKIRQALSVSVPVAREP